MSGYLARFGEWTEIDSLYEGHFLERLAQGAFRKTFAENRERMKVLFEHGLDPQIGKKVLGPIARLEELEEGASYEVQLLDTSYNRDLLPGLKAGLYGSSFRFAIVREDFVLKPPRSAHNPKGIPERTLTEVSCREFGPCTWPAYQNATAGARSLTDEFLLEQLAEDPERLEAMLSRSARYRSVSHRVSRGHTLSPGDLAGVHVEGNSVNANGFAVSNLDTPAVRTLDESTRSKLYRRCAEYVGEAAWAIHPKSLGIILGILGERRSGERPSDEEIRERIGLRADSTDIAVDGPVAVIPIQGPILPRASLMQQTSGLVSAETVQAAFQDAVDSADVRAILLNIDSPGGSADLVPELARAILNARGSKPIVAIANTWAASAAYWIACAADELVVTPSGKVGSIGVYSAHQDVSAQQEMEGVKVTLVSAAPYKTEGNPFEPLSEEAKAEMQRVVDAYYQMFVGAVAKGRGVSASDVRDNFGQGRMVLATDAVKAGMADRVATFEETLARLEKLAASSGKTSSSASAEADDAGGVEATVEPLVEAPPPSQADASAPIQRHEPEPSGATTQETPAEPEPSEATTRTPRAIYGLGQEAPKWKL